MSSNRVDHWPFDFAYIMRAGERLRSKHVPEKNEQQEKNLRKDGIMKATWKKML